MSHRTSSDAASGHDSRGRDVAWNFGESVDGSRTKIKCTFCGKVINGGITRLKEHLGHVKGNVAKCNNVTTDVRRNMEQLLQEMKNNKMEKRRRDLIVEEEITRATLRGEDEDEEDEHVQAILRRSRLEADLEYEQNRYMMDHHEHYHEGGSSRQQPLRPMGRSSSLSVRGSRGSYEYAPSSTPAERLATMDASLEREHQKMKQTKINPGTKAFKMLKGKLRKAWGQWITHNKVQFSAIESPFTKPLMTTIREVGERVPPPSAYELAEVYLKEEYQSLKKWTDSLLPQWKQWGVTIMCDGWTGPTKMHLINFLIYSKMGTVFHKSVDATNVPSKDADYYFRLMKKVVEEVGPEIVIQVVTDNEAAIKAGGKKLMQEFPHLYWTGCAAHCIDLILADISKKSNIHKVLQMAQSITQFIYRYDKVVAIMLQFTNGRQLLRPGITRFATNFIALESIIKHKSSLRNMWESEQWKCSKYGKMNDDHAIQVRDIILQLTEEGRKFWSKANDVIKVQEPLVKVLRLVDGDQKPTMGFLYEAMERAKLAIKTNCRFWERYWQIIDHRWDFQLHHDLHAAGYFLNPQFTYERHDYNIREDEEVMRGVKKVIQRLEPNIDNQIRALNELEIYSLKQEDFNDIVTQRAVKFTNPVFGHQNNPAYLVKCPKVVVTSYKMLHRLRTSMLDFEWATLIVDESHHVRCSKKKSEPGEIKAVLDVAEKVKHIILLSGTPSLSRPFDIFHQINMLWPGLLGKDKYEFAKTYCSVKYVQKSQGKTFRDFSQGSRLEELNILLRQTVMIRRLKAHLLLQLPPKRRQIIRLLLRKADIIAAKNAVMNCNSCDDSTAVKCSTEDKALEPADRENDAGNHMSTKNLPNQVLGIAKVSGFLEWLSLHPIITEPDNSGDSTMNVCSHKMIIFAHHHKVLDKVQEFICEKDIGFVRIDGNTLDRDRQSAVNSFQSTKEIKIAMIGIEVGYAGINLSAAQAVVFLEIPKKPTDLIQAEDRAHRRGQMNSVNIYIFCAMDTVDESRWQRLNKSLHSVSSMTDGKYDAVQEIAVERVCCLKDFGNVDQRSYEFPHSANPAFHEYSDVEHLWDLDENDCEDDQVDKLCKRSQNILDDIPEKLVEACSPLLASFLRFAVSQYTGRIHLCTCITGVDSRPRPLFENFRPEEITSGCNIETACTLIENNSSYREVLVSFVNQWEKLKCHEKRKLLGKPLQLPLSVELACLNERTNHDSRGLLKSGSRKRNTPLSDLSCPLPSNAMWKDVKIGGGCRKKEMTYLQAWTLMNEPLCKLCQNPCKGVNSKKPEFFEDLFCKLECYEEYRSRTSNRFLRQELFQIEHGICTNCQLDCHKLVQHIRPLTLANREEYIKRNAPNIAIHKKLFDRLVFDPTEGNAWHADHVVPVYRGGGECRVDNLRTLCVACHSDVTTAQCTERRLAKKQLQMALSDHRKSSKMIQTRVKSMEQAIITVEEKTTDAELLIHVPGSAYSVLK